ncbi:MAG TPA: hypothetical protein VF604_04875 [Pyrinomonadaceae bacterium]|jgi:hypothetical protein
MINAEDFERIRSGLAFSFRAEKASILPSGEIAGLLELSVASRTGFPPSMTTSRKRLSKIFAYFYGFM